MKKVFYLALAVTAVMFVSCKNNEPEVIGEKPVTDGAMQLEGLAGEEAGSSALNSVFVDLSTNKQTSVLRTSWNLGFYTGSSFAVKMNETTGSTAVKADVAIDAVVSEEAIADYTTALSLNYTDKFVYLDDMDGDLSKNIIKANDVYVVSLGENQTPLYKVQVTEKDANTYTLKYAKINESAVKTIDIAKNSAYNFVYVSFEKGTTVDVEPEATKWDIRWSKTLSKTAMGPGFIPYAMADFVSINTLAGVQVAVVTPETKTYDAFTASDVDGLTFASNYDFIGSTWRATTGENIGVFNQFYVIKDPAGNYYKLQFLTMGVNNDGGTRGKPELKFALVK